LDRAFRKKVHEESPFSGRQAAVEECGEFNAQAREK
jgi:hypothetical protein